MCKYVLGCSAELELNVNCVVCVRMFMRVLGVTGGYVLNATGVLWYTYIYILFMSVVGFMAAGELIVACVWLFIVLGSFMGLHGIRCVACQMCSLCYVFICYECVRS